MSDCRIVKLYNNPKYSDFKILNQQMEPLYLHKCILSDIPYFDTYFNTKIGNSDKRNYMLVDNLEPYKIICKYIYNQKDELDHYNKLDLNLYIELVKLSDIFELHKYKDILFSYLTIHNHYKSYLDESLESANIFYLFFSNRGECCLPRGNSNSDIYYSWFIHNDMIAYLRECIVNHSIPEDILNWEIIKILPIDLLIQIYIRLNKLQELFLNNINFISYPNFNKIFSKFYHYHSNILTPEQVNALTSYKLNSIQNPKYLVPPAVADKFLDLKSFIPFNGIIYKKIGIPKKSINNEITIFLMSNIKINDIIQFNTIDYIILDIIYINTDKHVSKAFANNLYKLQLNSEINIIDNKNFEAYKIKHIN